MKIKLHFDFFDGPFTQFDFPEFDDAKLRILELEVDGQTLFAVTGEELRFIQSGKLVKDTRPPRIRKVAGEYYKDKDDKK